MKSFIKRLLKNVAKTERKSTSRRDRGVKLGMEALETRLVPAGITDMTVLAQQWPTHDGPTHLYLNFDGYNDGTTMVNAYNKSAQQINEIIFRTSEIFAPFNVEVSRVYGFNSHDDGNAGSTTIFIGDNPANNGTDKNGKAFNGVYSGTPAANTDLPGSTLGDKHAINSNPFDLAFVDPVGRDVAGKDTSLGVAAIAQSIAHEAGHTFGLAHITTPGGSTNEMMSYNSSNQFFADATFNISALNNNGTATVNDPTKVPKYNGTSLVTQNSYTFLEQVLGDRPDGTTRHIVHAGSVDSAHYSAPATNLTPYSPKTGTLDRLGDYSVYWMKVTRDWSVHVDVTPQSGDLNPNLFVYNAGNLVNYTDSWWNSGTSRQEVFGVVRADRGPDLRFCGRRGRRQQHGRLPNQSDRHFLHWRVRAGAGEIRRGL